MMMMVVVVVAAVKMVTGCGCDSTVLAVGTGSRRD